MSNGLLNQFQQASNQAAADEKAKNDELVRQYRQRFDAYHATQLDIVPEIIKFAIDRMQKCAAGRRLDVMLIRSYDRTFETGGGANKKISTLYGAAKQVANYFENEGFRLSLEHFDSEVDHPEMYYPAKDIPIRTPYNDYEYSLTIWW